MTGQQHCPGFEANKKLEAVQIKCPKCGLEMEIFSDEIEKKHKCTACSVPVDPKKCTVQG